MLFSNLRSYAIKCCHYATEDELIFYLFAFLFTYSFTDKNIFNMFRFIKTKFSTVKCVKCVNSLIAVNMLLIEMKQKKCHSQPNFSSYSMSDVLHVAAAHCHYQVVVFVKVMRKWCETPKRDVWIQFRKLSDEASSKNSCGITRNYIL
jgi:hypothetical protein